MNITEQKPCDCDLTDRQIREKFAVLCTENNPDGGEFPPCPFLHNNICMYLTEHVGRLYPVNPIFCKGACKKEGPYCGRDVTENNNDFLLRAFQRLMGGYINKVYKRFQNKTTIIIPPMWPEIECALKHLYEDESFSRILLTGSMIVKEVQTYKDIDVVLEFHDMSEFIDNSQEFHKQLPPFIAGYPADYYFKSVLSPSETLFFTYLDPVSKTFYTTKWFDFDYEVEGLSVVTGESELVKKVIETYKEKNSIKTGESIQV